MSDNDVNRYFATEKCKRKKRGRPRLEPEDRMSERRMVNLRSKEARLLDSLAKGAGKSFNLWAREILLAAAERQVLQQQCEVLQQTEV
jgi:predicted HicB family RNase H-like nuclease